MHQPSHLSVTQAAKVLGRTVGRVRQMLLAGEIRGEKLGSYWAIPRSEIDRVRREIDRSTDGRRRPGRQ